MWQGIRNRSAPLLVSRKTRRLVFFWPYIPATTRPLLYECVCSHHHRTPKARGKMAPYHRGVLNADVARGLVARTIFTVALLGCSAQVPKHPVATSGSQPHYYRIQGPPVLVEFDNSQGSANHIHTVWRDLENDFGGDLLRTHYARQPHSR